jgi:CheY-like chemotaxis protein
MAALHGTAILVADDDADSREVLEYIVHQAGGTVRSAATANEALEVLLTWTPDVLLLDISMPTMDGFELLETIRGVSRLREIPAVAVTAHAYAADRQRCIEAGFAEHVSKPYDGDALLDLVARLAPKKASA